MKKLYPVEPIGLGTGDVESLNSYLLRLAAAHCTTVGILLRTLGDQRDYKSGCHVPRVQQALIETLVRPNRATASAIEVLAEATHLSEDTIGSMTMMRLDNALSRQVGFYTSQLRWCSSCIREQQRSRNGIYFKLVWMFCDLDRCPRHHSEFRNACPSCYRSQTSVGRRHSIGRCAYCGGDLAADDLPVADAVAKVGASNEILNLVAYMAGNPTVRFPKDGFKVALDLLEKESLRLHSESAYQKATGGKSSRLVYPTMRNVLRISDMLHVPAINLLLGEIKGVNFDLLPTDDTDRPERTLVRRGPWRDRRVIEAEAWEYFESGGDGRHPTLADTASHLGLSASGFHYLFPQFAAHIVKTHLQETSLNASAFAASLSQHVRELINQHYADRVRGFFPLGRKEVSRQLLMESRWSKNHIREEVERAFAAAEMRED